MKRKGIALILVCVLVLSFTATAFAGERDMPDIWKTSNEVVILEAEQ